MSGPLPPEVYRRRRLAVLAAIVVTVGLVAWIFTSGGGDDAASGDGPPADRTPAAARQGSQQPPRPAPTVTVTVTVTATPAPAPKETVTVTATPERYGKPCGKVPMRLSVRTNKDAYPASVKPRFRVRAEPKKRCLLDLDKLELVITSGTDRIWSSQDCPGRDRRPRRITPRRPYENVTTWQRARSNPAKCGEKTEVAKPGWYVVTATLGEKTSNEAVFRLK